MPFWSVQLGGHCWLVFVILRKASLLHRPEPKQVQCGGPNLSNKVFLTISESIATGVEHLFIWIEGIRSNELLAYSTVSETYIASTIRDIISFIFLVSLNLLWKIFSVQLFIPRSSVSSFSNNWYVYLNCFENRNILFVVVTVM